MFREVTLTCIKNGLLDRGKKEAVGGRGGGRGGKAGGGGGGGGGGWGGGRGGGDTGKGGLSVSVPEATVHESCHVSGNGQRRLSAGIRGRPIWPHLPYHQPNCQRVTLREQRFRFFSRTRAAFLASLRHAMLL